MPGRHLVSELRAVQNVGLTALNSVLQELPSVFQIDCPLACFGEFARDHGSAPGLVLLKFGEVGKREAGMLAFAEQGDPFGGFFADETVEFLGRGSCPTGNSL